VAGQGRQSDEQGSARQRLPQRRTQRHPQNQPGCTSNPGTLVWIKHRGPLHEDSSAPRRGLADGVTEQAPGSAVGSPALAGTSPSPSRHRCRAPQAPSTGPRLGVPSGQSGGRGGPGCLSGCLPRRSRLSACSVASTRPVSGVRCPVSGVRCPVSGVTVRCPRMRCPPVRCPMSGCGRPVSRVGVRAFRVRCVCTGDFVERVGAAGSLGQEGPGSGRPAVSANGSTIC
jgi:hypothetical protein